MGKILLFFITITLMSCSFNTSQELDEQHKKENTESPSEDDYKIINSTFVHLAYWGPEEIKREFGYDNFISDNKIPTEYLTEVYFTKYLVATFDSTVFRTKIALPDKPFSNLSDFEYKNLSEKLITLKNSNVKLDIGLINNVGSHRLIPLEMNHKINREIGDRIITYSRIQYNQSKDKACFYFQNSCSGLCGSAKFVFVAKIKGIWTITDKRTAWVS